MQKLAGAVKTILECVGEDADRDGLEETPMRYAKALMYFTKGYEENVRDLVNGAVFQEDHDELVIVRDIEVFSLCEHHMVPFSGKVGNKSYDTIHANYCADAYWVHSESSSPRLVQVCTPGGDVLTTATGSRTSDEASSACDRRSLETTRCCSSHGVKPSLHGNEGSRENHSTNNH